MGKGHREDKAKAGEARRRVKAQIEEVFHHYKKNVLYEEQLFQYYIKKGLSRKEVEKLVIDAIGMNIIRIGAKSIIRKGNQLENLGDITVFRLLSKDKE